MLIAETFASWAKEFGFAEVGFCSLSSFAQAKQVVNAQEPLSERRQLHFSPEDDFPQAKSMAVLLWPYVPVQLGSKETVFVDSYYQASNAAYHAARRLEEKLLESGIYAKANVSYPAKEAAIRAGLGIIGLNSLLITPKYGSRVVIILMVTDIEIPLRTEILCAGHECQMCRMCAKSCPVGAIDDEGMTHPERCLRNFMMEGVVVPKEYRGKIGMRLIGCDICQRVCPMQTTPPGKREEPYFIKEFVSDDTSAFSRTVTRLADEIGRNTARPQRVRAQAALLAGNSKDPAYLPVLNKWAQAPFEAVREHALWAIEQIESAQNYT